MSSVLAPAAAAAHAAPQTSTVSGTFTVLFAAPPTFQQIDATCFIEAPVRFEFTGMLAGWTDTQGHTDAQLVMRRGTGVLTGLHGQLTLIGQAGAGGRYSGAVPSWGVAAEV